MKTLKVEMIHDVVCSWCPIGYRHLTSALNNLQIEAEMRFLPSELNPDIGPEGEAINQYLLRRNNWTEAELNTYKSDLLKTARNAGVTIDYEKRTHYYNTRLAHHLMHIAERYDKQREMNELLIDAYFKRGLNISQKSTLLELAEQLGLEKKQTEAELESPTTRKQFEQKRIRVSKLGLRSIPGFIFNDAIFISGSNSVAYFEELILGLSKDTFANAI